MPSLNKLITAAIIALAITTPAQAQTPAIEHNHGHDEHGASALTLDHGKKWQTDEALRQGMQSIRTEVMNNVDAFHHNQLTQANAEKIAKHINDQIGLIASQCKLKPEADAALHVIIGELLTAAEALTKDPQSMQGLPAMVGALQQYPEYFEHKGWKGVEH